MTDETSDPFVPRTPTQAALVEARHPAERHAALGLAVAQRDLGICRSSGPEQIAEYDDVTDPVPEYAAWLERMVEHERWARVSAQRSVADGEEYDRSHDRVVGELGEVTAEAIRRARAVIAAMTGPDEAGAAAARADVLRRWPDDDEAALAALPADAAAPVLVPPSWWPVVPTGTAMSVEQRPAGGWVARCRVRDADGKTRSLVYPARSRTAAVDGLLDALQDRAVSALSQLKPQHTFERAARVWLARLDDQVAQGIRQARTVQTYRYQLDAVLLPVIGRWRLEDCTPERLNGVLRGLAATQHRRARKTARTVVVSVLGLAGRYSAFREAPESGPRTLWGQR